MPKISNRVSKMPESPVRNMDAIACNVKGKGINILHLNIGDPDILTPQVFWDAIKNYDTSILSYAPSEGLDILRTSMVNYFKSYNVDYNIDDILITAGGSEALSLVLSTICDYQEEVIVFEPFYTNYNGFCDVVDVNTVAITTQSSNGFHLPNKEAIVSKITDKTKAILFSNPGNPTGTVYTKEEIMMLAQIAIEYDLFIVSDEVYREFVYDGKEYISLGSVKEIEDRVIIIDSISKRFSACGARVGCIASKSTLFMKQVLKVCQNRLCVATIEQIGASALYDNIDKIIPEVKKEYDKRRNLLYDCLNGIEGINFIKPEGAFYLILDLPINDAKHFVTWLLTEFSIDKETVMLAPAQGFYRNQQFGQSQVRIAYILDCDKLKRAANIIIKGLEQYRKIYK